MTQALGPVETTFVLPIGGGGAPVPWRYLTANGHTAEFLDASDDLVLTASFGIDYTITPDGDTAANAGTLTLLRAAPVGATKLILRRRTAKVQNYVATPGAEGIAVQLDRLTLVAQETEATGGGSTLSALEALWLGPKAADPTVDNQGAPLLPGAVYFNTVSAAMRLWTGVAWINLSAVIAGDMLKADSLLGLADYALALDRLGGQPVNSKLTSLAGLAVAVGDLFIGVVGGLVGRLAIGANGKVLGIVAGALAWIDQVLPAHVASAEFFTWESTRCTFVHGLGRNPRQVRWFLQCTTATQGYSVGDRLSWGSGQSYGTSQNGGAAYENATEVSMYAADVTGRHKTTDAGFQLTSSANWKLVVEVW